MPLSTKAASRLLSTLRGTSRSVRDRLEREDLTVLAYRFAGDKICRAERFAAYQAALGDHFVARTLPDSAANTDVAPFFARYVIRTAW